MQPPNYFTEIQRRASARWGQLEGDLELRGPWDQLFRQVQSPRHVVSELLQNADDAGAKAASIRIDDNTFIFEHDGVDFDAEQFTSLCRFGFSNKRTLHTIGFRGVGFKSTFSLGNTVEIRTPTLAVCFSKKRFTEPVWINDVPASQRTVIRVRISDSDRAAQLRKSFREWSQSPASLLFFNSLKEITIEEKTIKCHRIGKGPVPEAAWVKLGIGEDAEKLLVVKSEAVPFPSDVAEEIRAERGIGAEDLHLPPCRVEIVLGLSGENRLYVVLPTGAGLELPFSSNAPFIQDPARFAIKDPATSPTNRWLLKRVGILAGQTMLQWLENNDLSQKERGAAYEMLKGVGDFGVGLDGSCSQIIMDSMMAELKGKRVVLTTGGKLAKPGESVAVPAELFMVWDTTQLLHLFAPSSQHLMATEISTCIHKLQSHGWINVVDTETVLQCLEQRDNVPRPAWPQVHALWAFIQKELCRQDWNYERRRRVRIVPVEGSRVLHATNDVVRLSTQGGKLSAADWSFVMDHAFTIDADWLGWISKRAPKDSSYPESFVGSKYRSLITPSESKDDPGYALLYFLGLHETSPVDRIVAQASLRIFSGKNIPIEDCVRVTHIMAALNATVPSTFRFATRDGQLRECGWGIICDDSGRVEDLTPARWAQQHILHEDYTRAFKSCKPEAWQMWVRSKGSGLLTSVPLSEKTSGMVSRKRVTEFALSRGGTAPKEFHYRREDFARVDFGFEQELIIHWDKIAKTDQNVWAGVLEGVLSSAPHHWHGKTEVEIRDNGNTYYKNLDCGFIPAEWLFQFRSAACLPDTHGKLHTPAELLLRNPSTEPVMGVEPFVKADLDNEYTKPLLKLLGVRDTPTDPDKLLMRLRAISTIPQPIRLIAEICRIYEALDRIVARCTSIELRTMTEAFAQKELVFTDKEDWVTSSEVSVFADDGDDSPVIHHAVRNLAMWPRLGITDRPAVGRTIEWLKSLSSGAKLDAATTKRVRTALQRDPVRIWQECGHWLTLDSTWVPVAALRYRLTMQSLMKWGELFPGIKAATANLQMLSVEASQVPPFSGIRNLGDAVEFRVTNFVSASRMGGTKAWLSALALGLCRAKLSNELDTRRIREVAKRLHQSKWEAFAHLDVMPYVDGAPAGEPFTPKVLWQDTSIYVAAQSTVRLFKDLAEELARPFDHKQVSDAIAACIDRTPGFVEEYLEAHFDLDKQLELPSQPEKPSEKLEVSTAVPISTTPVSQQGDGCVDDSADTADIHGGGTSSGDAEIGDGERPGEDTQGPAGGQEESKSPPPKPSLIEIYAKQRGFRFHAAEKCFTHPDGRWIEKSESPFNWEERAAGGELVSRMWVTDQKLVNGVEIAAELWTLISQQPDLTTLIVVRDDHTPCALTGQELLELKDSRQIMLHPARYRIVENQ